MIFGAWPDVGEAKLGALLRSKITERQYQRLKKGYSKTGVLNTAAIKAGMHRETAAKYHELGHGPVPEKRRGRRRPDPLATIWADAERLLLDAPELEAKPLFEHWLGLREVPEAQRALRTFQRRVLSWQRAHGEPKEVFFPQARDPGATLQLDWTNSDGLGVVIGGEPWAGMAALGPRVMRRNDGQSSH